MHALTWMLASAAAAALATAAQAAEAPPQRIETLKEMHLQTPLVADGQPRCSIAVPEGKEYADLAAALNARIRERTGQALPVVPADTVDEAALRRGHLIALGNLMVSRPIGLLQCLGHVRVDAPWPGEEGFVVRSVHDPLGTGFNAIVLGGSNPAGVRKAVEHLGAAIAGARQASLSVGFLHQVEASAARPALPTDESIAAAVREVEGKSYGAVAGATHKAAVLARTWGDAAFVRQFKALMGAFEAAVDGMEAVDDLRTAVELPLMWDCIEEHPEFSDAERLRFTNVFLRYALKVPYALNDVAESAVPHGNNWNAEGSASAGRYFERYYPALEIGPRIMDRMRRYYAADVRHWKPSEDCPGYGDITVRETMHWSLRSLDFEWFRSGNARRIADYNLLIVNNLGSASGFGDYRGLGGKYAVAVWPVVAWHERDGRYLWMYRKCGGTGAEFWRDDVEPVEPVDMLGVKHAGLPEWVYQRREERAIPFERCFDKMAFRRSFDEQEEYLCLSGFSGGFHSHPDGNAVVSLTDRGHAWLFDDGYMVPEMNEHNTVTVVHDGESQALPELVELAGKADLPDTGMTRTVVSDYCGTRWARHILWRKGEFFLFFDELQAQEPGEFGFQCIWRTLGERRLDGPRYTVTQGEEEFHVVNADGAALSLKDCRKGPGGSKALYQSWSGDLQPGAARVFINALYAAGAGEGKRVDVELAGGNAAVLRTEKDVALAGIGEIRGPGAVRAQADLAFLSPAQWRFLNATAVAGAGLSLKADAPVTGWLDLADGKGELQAEREARVTLQVAPGAEVRLGAAAVKADAQGNAALAVPAGKGVSLAFPPAPAAQAATLRQALIAEFDRRAAASRQARASAAGATARNITPLWAYAGAPPAAEGAAAPRVRALAAFDLDGDGNEEIVSGTQDGTVTAIGADGKVRWTVRLGGAVNAIAAADIDGDGRGEVIAGCSDKKLYVLNADGSERRCEAPPPRTYERPGYRGVEPFQGALLVVFTEDINGDGKREILIGSANWWTYCYDPAGKLLWSTVNWAHNATCGTAADIDGDGKPEVLMGNDYASVQIYRNDGELLPGLGMSWHAGPSAIAAADLNGDGRAEVVCGDLGGRVTFHAVGGAKLPSYEIGTPITAVRIARLRAGKALQAVVASRNYYLYAFDEAGRRLWHRNMGDVPTDVAVADLNGDGRDEVVAACEDGRVCVLDGEGKELAAWRLGAAAGPVVVARRKGGGLFLAAAAADGGVRAGEMAR